jgi:hypothetical protein
MKLFPDRLLLRLDPDPLAQVGAPLSRGICDEDYDE